MEETFNGENLKTDDECDIVTIEYDTDEAKMKTEKYSELSKAEESTYFCDDMNSPSNSSEEGLSMSSKKPGRKTDKERDEVGQRREWTDHEILHLMQLWKDNNVLYDTKHPLYYVQTERKAAMDLTSRELGISSKDVNDKMHSLRTYYCSQRQRTEAYHLNPGNMKQLPRWKFYDQMSFLYESVTNRAHKSSLSGRSRRTREISRNEQPTFLNLQGPPMSHYPDIYSSGTPPRQYSPGYRIEHNLNLERTQKQPSYVSHNNAPFDERGQKRRMSDSSPDAPEVDTEPYSDYKVVKNQVNAKLNSPDEIFGHMIACSLAQIRDEQQKERLKLDIQTMIFNTRFKQPNSITN